ncbi:MAG: thiolase family protein [Desulfatiglandaceae bacterium]|jgi:acetyl-CoA acetyltransferase
MIEKAFIPYKGYYSTPFCKWQGSFANENAIVLGGETARRWLAEKKWSPEMLDYLFCGITVGQPHQFYSSVWAAALIGAGNIPGVSISQACSTGATCVYLAGLGVESGLYQTACILLVDRTSNSPHTIWPNPTGPGAQVISEDWMIDNFNSDPNVGLKMIETAEKVARDGGFTKEQCDELSLQRFEQYQASLADDRAFQKGYMFPAEIKLSKKKTILVEEDQGITPTSAEGLARLKPVIDGGVHSFGAQTHPADGNCAIIVTTKENAKTLSTDPAVTIQVIAYGYFREKKGRMAAAPGPAAQMALDAGGLKISDMKAIKTHNPFVVNDLYMAKLLGINPAGSASQGFNNYGCSLIYGHPQAPTAGRLIIEGIEEVVQSGGGYLLWAGCAAGDTAAALLLKIGT